MQQIKELYKLVKFHLTESVHCKDCRVAFGYGLLITFLLWCMQWLAAGCAGFCIVDLHRQNVLLYLADLLPFLLMGMCHKYKEMQNIQEQLLQENMHKDELFNQYASIASEIQQGNYSFTDEDIDTSNQMGKTLLMIQQDQIATKEKENLKTWRTRGREIIADILRKPNDLQVLTDELLVALINYSGMIQGAFYIYDEDDDSLHAISTYAYNRKKYINQKIRTGYGLIGQATFEKASICRYEIPDDYFTISSGLIGDARPKSLLIIPLLADNKVQGVLELASLKLSFTAEEINFNERMADMIAQSIFILKANTKTQHLLKDSQKLTAELRQNQQQLIEQSEQIKQVNVLLEESNKTLEEHMQDLRQSEHRIQAILEQATEVISIYNVNAKLIYESASVKHILGQAPVSMANKDGLSFIHEQAVYKIKQLIDLLVQIPYKTQQIEFKFSRKDGTLCWLESTGRNLLDNPAIEGIIITTRDITIFKQAEQEHRMKGQMQALSENSPDMIVRISPDKKIFYANPVFEEYTGLKRQTSLQKKIAELPMHPSCATLMSNTVDEVLNMRTRVEKEYSIARGQAQQILMTNAIPEVNDEQEIESILLVAHDITIRKTFELEIQDKNKKISDSINYAYRLQSSIMPTAEVLQQHFGRSFMFYKPRDVVSGDFPWVIKHDDATWVAVVDCTGHGVPGALLSFVGHFHLTAIVEQYPHLTPAEVLDRLHLAVRHTLKQDVEGAEARDGMDIALCKVDQENLNVQFAGAHRPLLHVRKQELTEIKGDRKAIGGIPLANKVEKLFTNHAFPVQQGDRFFIFSDGLPDQEGGEEGKKYAVKRIRSLVTENYDLTIREISRMFEEDLHAWKGQYKQLDDILIIGIEF